MEHRPEHERWIEAQLTSEATRDGAERTELLACAVCAPELAALEDLKQTLSAAGREQRVVLAEACGAGFTAGDAPARRGRLLRMRWVAAAVVVAAGVLAVFALRPRHEGSTTPGSELAAGASRAPERPDVVLGSDQLGELSPSGAVQGFDAPFRWKLALPPQGWYVVRVYEPGPDGKLLAQSRRLERAEWTCDSKLTAGWTRIRWEVVAYGSDGTPQGSLEASAERSSS